MTKNTSRFSEHEVALIQKSREFSRSKHEGVFRKNSEEPYFNHPDRVAAMVEEFGGDAEQIAAAYLHDVVEDTDVEIDEILKEFGPNVANLVIWLTNRCHKSHGNRKMRKMLEREFFKHAPDRAKTVKVCDIIDNISDMSLQPKSFADLYLSEKIEFYEHSLYGANEDSLKKLRCILPIK